MNIHVGLTDSLGEPYKEEFGSWLKKTLEKNYGNLATSEVSFIKSAPKSENKNLLDYISELQGLIGAILVSLFVLISIILAKVMGSKDAKEQRKFTAQLQQQMQMREDERLQQKQPEVPREVFEETPIALPEPVKQLSQFEVTLLHDLHTKVMKTAQESGNKVQEVLKSWLESGDRGFFKIACLVDVTISNEDSKTTPISKIDWQEIVSASSKKKMKDVFKQMADLSSEEKIKILDEVYWDLVSLKTLGPKSMIEPFQFISSLSVKERKEILASQNSKTQTLAVLHLPDEAREEYIKDLPFEGKRSLLEETLQMDDVLTTDVEAASETLKFVVDRMESGKETISIRSMYPRLLGSFSTIDEITLLREISKRISDDGLSIKASHPTLAFIDEWPEDKARFVFDAANADEVLTLLRIIPESKDKVLKFCPPRVQDIVTSDFDKQDKSDVATKEKHLSSLRAKFLKAINKQKIDLEAVFPAKNGDKGGLRAA